MKPLPPTEPAGELLWIGGKVDEASVSLRFFGDDLEPERISHLLQCQPSQAFRKGEELPRRHYMLAKTGSWILRSPRTAEQDLEQQIAGLLDRLPDDLQVWAQVKKNCRGNLFCGLFLKEWNRGFSLSSELMTRITERHLSLDFDIYCDAEAETEGEVA